MPIRGRGVATPTRNYQHNQALTAHWTAPDRSHPQVFAAAIARRLPETGTL
jgi:hypothetical protein